MTDITLNAYLGRGSQADRLALAPNPQTGLAVVFFENDTKRMYLFDPADATWRNISGPRVVVDNTAARALAATDSQSYIQCTNNAGITVTVTPQSGTAWGPDTTISFEQSAPGQITFAAGAGVTINVSPSYQRKSAEQYGVVQLIRTALNTWTLFGALAFA